MPTELPTKFRFEEDTPLPDFSQTRQLYNVEKQPLTTTLYQSIFKAPIKLGEYIAESNPALRGAREEVKRLRSLGGDYAKYADQIEAEIGKKPTTSQIVGASMGTALLATPTVAIKGIKAGSVLGAFVQGGLYGTAYGMSDAMIEGQSLDKVITQGIKGGVIGAPLGAASNIIMKGAFKGTKALTSWAASKTPQTVKDGLTRLLSPTMNRLKALGEYGDDIVRRFQAAGDKAKMKMGDAAVKMADVGLVEAPRLFPWQKSAPLLTSAQAWQADDSVLNVLLGRATAKSQEISVASKVARRILDEIAESADDAGVLIGKRVNYFPHILPSPKSVSLSVKEQVALSAAKSSGNVKAQDLIQLQSAAKESLRRDILENATHKLGAFNSISEAADVLDAYTAYVQAGSRIIDKKVEPLMKYLVKSGQATSMKEAESLAYRQLIQRASRRITQYGPLEYARKINIPFWDPDPRRVLPSYTFQAISRVEEATQFGAKNRTLNTLITKIRRTTGVENAKMADELVRTITGQIQRAPGREQLSLFLRSLQTPKLAFAQIINLGQNLNTLMATDFKSLGYGLASAFRSDGVRNAMKTGAVLNSVIKKQLSYLGGSQFSDKFLKYTGFQWTELFNRTVAANAAQKYANITFAKLQNDTTNGVLRWRLQEMGIDPDDVLAKGVLGQNELLKAGNILSSKTQFLSEPMNLPAWASSPEGKVFFQFKNYAYNQTLFVKNQLASQWNNKDFTKVVKTVMTLGLLFPITGEALGDIRALVTRQKRPTKFLDRWLSDIQMSGTFGLAADLWSSAAWGKFTEGAFGPTVGTISDLMDALTKSVQQEDIDPALKFALTQTGILRPLKNYLYPSKQKNVGSLMDFLDSF